MSEIPPSLIDEGTPSGESAPAFEEPVIAPMVDPELGRLIDNVLIAGSHHLAWLKVDHPPFGWLSPDGVWVPTPLADGFRHYHPKGTPLPNDRPAAAFDLWVGCRAIEALRMRWTGSVGAPVASVAPPERETHGSIEFVEPVEPDEAVSPVAGPVDRQPRLAGIS
jgi:hypothetical protein